MKKAVTGFTLIELMTVVAIVGIMSSIAVSSFSKSQARQDASEEFTQLEGLLREARGNARVRMRCVRITVTKTTFQREEFEDCDESNSLEVSALKIFKKIELTPESFLFDENASVDRDDAVEISALGEHYQNTVKIFPAIGTIRRN